MRAGFKLVITAPPVQALVRSATQLAAAGYCFLPDYRNLNPSSSSTSRLPKPKPPFLVSLAVYWSVIACSILILATYRSQPPSGAGIYGSHELCRLFKPYIWVPVPALEPLRYNMYISRYAARHAVTFGSCTALSSSSPIIEASKLVTIEVKSQSQTPSLWLRRQHLCGL